MMQQTITMLFIIGNYLIREFRRCRSIIAIEHQNVLTRNNIEQRCLPLTPYATIKLCQSSGVDFFELAEINDGISLDKICAADMRNGAIIGPGNHGSKVGGIDEVQLFQQRVLQVDGIHRITSS